MLEFAKYFLQDDLLSAINTSQDPLFLERVAFLIASFLMPKTLIDSFTLNKPEIQNICHKYQQLVSYIKNNGYYSGGDIKKTIAQFLTDDFYGVLNGKSL